MILIYISIIILFLIYIPKIYYYINKKRHPFSGKIETFKDVNDFIANYDFFHFSDKDDDNNEEEYDFYIVNAKRDEKVPDSDYVSGYKIVNVYSGVYKTYKNDSYWFFLRNKDLDMSNNIRAFIWRHKDAINAQLEIERIEEEKDRKEKEKILQLKELDKNIKKDVFKFLRGTK